jgi:hypothetical protein
MAIVLISKSPLSSNYAECENDAIAGQNEGVIEWANPYKEAGVWKVDFSGTNVKGDAIPPTTKDIDEAQTINPTKVFWWLVDKAKDLICPDCDTP